MAIDLVRELRAQQQRTLPRQYIPDLTARAAEEIERLRAALTICANHANDMPRVVKTAVEALESKEGDR